MNLMSSIANTPLMTLSLGSGSSHAASKRSRIRIIRCFRLIRSGGRLLFEDILKKLVNVKISFLLEQLLNGAFFKRVLKDYRGHVDFPQFYHRVKCGKVNFRKPYTWCLPDDSKPQRARVILTNNWHCGELFIGLNNYNSYPVSRDVSLVACARPQFDPKGIRQNDLRKVIRGDRDFRRRDRAFTINRWLGGAENGRLCCSSQGGKQQ